MALTDHQKTVLHYIEEFQQKHGYSPSLADLAKAFNVKSKNAIAKVVKILVREGHLEKDPRGRIKIIELLENAAESIAKPVKEALTLPFFGPISAGFAAPVEEQAEDLLDIEEFLVRDKSATFLLRVRGDSMIEAGIHEGDIMLVERGKEPRVGDIVVGVLDGEFTLKTLMKQNGKFYLRAENSNYPDMYALDELQVAGVAVGLVRQY